MKDLRAILAGAATFVAGNGVLPQAADAQVQPNTPRVIQVPNVADVTPAITDGVIFQNLSTNTDPNPGAFMNGTALESLIYTYYNGLNGNPAAQAGRDQARNTMLASMMVLRDANFFAVGNNGVAAHYISQSRLGGIKQSAQINGLVTTNDPVAVRGALINYTTAAQNILGFIGEVNANGTERQKQDLTETIRNISAYQLKPGTAYVPQRSSLTVDVATIGFADALNNLVRSNAAKLRQLDRGIGRGADGNNFAPPQQPLPGQLAPPVNNGAGGLTMDRVKQLQNADPFVAMGEVLPILTGAEKAYQDFTAAFQQDIAINGRNMNPAQDLAKYQADRFTQLRADKISVESSQAIVGDEMKDFAANKIAPALLTGGQLTDAQRQAAKNMAGYGALAKGGSNSILSLADSAAQNAAEVLQRQGGDPRAADLLQQYNAVVALQTGEIPLNPSPNEQPKTPKNDAAQPTSATPASPTMSVAEAIGATKENGQKVLSFMQVNFQPELRVAYGKGEVKPNAQGKKDMHSHMLWMQGFTEKNPNDDRVKNIAPTLKSYFDAKKAWDDASATNLRSLKEGRGK